MGALQFITTFSEPAAEMTINVWGQIGAPAPAAMWFEASVTGNTGLIEPIDGFEPDASGAYTVVNANAEYGEYDQQFHELEFEWSFGDTGVWQYADRLPTQLQQRDYGHGKIVAHAYSTPGDKTVTCTAYRMGVDGSGNLTRATVATKTITFASGGDYPSIPDVLDLIPAERRVYLNLTTPGDTTDVPSGATVAMGFGSMYTFLNAGTDADPRAAFIRRGSTATWVGAFNHTLTKQNRYIGTYGTGARPLIVANDRAFGTSNFNYTSGGRGGWYILTDMEMEGQWDTVNDTGTLDQAATGTAALMHHHVHGCLFRDLAGTVMSIPMLDTPTTLNVEERSVIVSDTEIDAWRDYGIMVRGNTKAAFRQDFAAIGTAIRQPANAAHGLTGDKNNRNAHGPIRIENARHVVMRGCDIFSRTDWDSGAQPCVRLYSNSAQQWGEVQGKANIYGNSFEGGTQSITSNAAGGTSSIPGVVLAPPADGDAYTWPANILVKHNLLLGSWSVASAVLLTRSCGSVVENVSIRPNVKRWGKSDSDQSRAQDFIISPLAGTDNGWVEDFNNSLVRNPARIIGNLTIDLKATTLGAGDELTVAAVGTMGARLQGLQIDRDNTLYAPAYDLAPVTSTGPWTYVSDVVPRDTYGIRHDSNEDGVFFEDATLSTPSDGLKLYRPAANAAVAGAATGPMSHRDFFGTVRMAGAPASAGAIEPSA